MNKEQGKCRICGAEGEIYKVNHRCFECYKDLVGESINKSRTIEVDRSGLKGLLLISLVMGMMLGVILGITIF